MDRSETARAAKTQVLISGAGPTGLLLAVELQRRGVDCLLVDELDAPRGWDRATVIQQKTRRPVQFEITEQTRAAIRDWLANAAPGESQYLFPSR